MVTHGGWSNFRTITCCTEKCADRAQRDAERDEELLVEVDCPESWVEGALWFVRLLYGEPEDMPWYWH